MNKKILSGLMALAMVAPAFANVTSAGGTGSVPVELNAAATSFSVTVPTGLPVDVAADGTITVSDKNYIVNNSFGPVEVKGAKIETANGWTLKDFGSRFETLKVNAKEFGFQLNECNVGTDGSVAVTNFKPIDGGAKQVFTYDAKVAPQAEDLSTRQIASVVFTLGWSGAEALPAGKPHARGTVMSDRKLDAQVRQLTGDIKIERVAYSGPRSSNVTDISEAGDGSVICVVNGQDATIYGDGGVLAPESYWSDGLFCYYSAASIDVSGLDTSKLTRMESFFWGFPGKILGLEYLDTSNVVYMGCMFGNLGSETNLDLRSFDTSKVTDMRRMFENSPCMETMDLSSFDMSGVTQTSSMFSGNAARKIYCRNSSDKQAMIHSGSRTPSDSCFIV